MMPLTAVNDGDTAWVLVCAALVLFMVPGLAMFCAGMVRSRNVLTMMQRQIGGHACPGSGSIAR